MAPATAPGAADGVPLAVPVQRLIAPWSRKSTVAKRIRKGTSFENVLSLVLVRSQPPSQPPSRLGGISRQSQPLTAARCFRYPKTPPKVPITSARVLVALAIVDDVPKNISVGNVSSVPPPATALMSPAAAAAAARPMISPGVIRETA